jgi:hypothetical protein
VNTYSPELIAETIACFQEEDGIVLSEDQAIAVLRGLSGLFLAFAEGEERARPP